MIFLERGLVVTLSERNFSLIDMSNVFGNWNHIFGEFGGESSQQKCTLVPWTQAGRR